MQNINKNVQNNKSFIFKLPFLRRLKSSKKDDNPDEENVRAFGEYLDRQWRDLKRREERKREIEQAKINSYKIWGRSF